MQLRIKERLKIITYKYINKILFCDIMSYFQGFYPNMPNNQQPKSTRHLSKLSPLYNDLAYKMTYDSHEPPGH